MITVDIHGMATDENQEFYVVILNGKDDSSDKWLPIQISPAEAENIAIQLNDMESDRPLSHDLLAEITEELEATVEKVRLDSQGTQELHGRVEISKPGSSDSFYLDAAPSDAIALALRVDAEIEVEEEIMQEHDPTDPAAYRNAHTSDEITRLQQQLRDAVQEEEFERASELKNEIRDALRRHAESDVQLDEDIDDQLKRAYEGSGSTGEMNQETPADRGQSENRE